jgi:hypothetical protein
VSKITLEELDKWIDGLDPKPQTTKYTIPDYPFFGLIVRPNGVKSIYIKNDNKKMCDVGFFLKGDGFSKLWNDFVSSKDYIRYEDTINILIEKYGLPKSGNPKISLEEACNAKSIEHYSSVFFYFALGRYSKLEDEYKKARDKYIKEKIETYKNFVNISVKGGGFILFLFIACAIIDNVEHLSTFFFVSYLILVFAGSFILTGILDDKASSLIASKRFEEAKGLSFKDNAEYRNAIKDELRRVNKRDRFLERTELFKVAFLEAKELLPEEFTKEVKSFSQASEIYYSLDGNIRELILNKTELLIDQIVERQIDDFISLKVRLEEKKEKIEKNMDKFINIIKSE